MFLLPLLLLLQSTWLHVCMRMHVLPCCITQATHPHALGGLECVLCQLLHTQTTSPRQAQFTYFNVFAPDTPAQNTAS
jgi:hypothetical protein